MSDIPMRERLARAVRADQLDRLDAAAPFHELYSRDEFIDKFWRLNMNPVDTIIRELLEPSEGMVEIWHLQDWSEKFGADPLAATKIFWRAMIQHIIDGGC